MKKTIFRILTLLVLVLPAYFTFFANHHPTEAISSVKDQLSSAQLSFFGRLSSYSGQVIKIHLTGGTAPSNTTANLSAGDTLAIANSGVTSVSIYNVRDIGDTSVIELTTAIGTTTPNAFIVATRSAIHTISFTPQDVSGVGESWLFLLKVTNRSGELWNDGMPDQTGFDIGSDVGSTTTGSGTRIKTADVTCPYGGSASIGETLVITSGVSTGYTGSYAVIGCAGVGTTGVGASMVVGRALATGSQIINPSPGTNHTVGQASAASDGIHSFAVRQISSLGSIMDTKFGKLATIESVRVTAIIDPTITFIVSNSGSTNPGASRCGSAIGNGAANTTATAVSFGPLGIGVSNDLSQMISCSTNGQNGFIVQAFENRVLTMLDSTTTIPDTTANNTTWPSLSTSGFGFSLEAGTTTSGTTFGVGWTAYQKFGVSTSATTIMSRTSVPPAAETAYVCYRITASTAQPPGTYENMVSYIATATF